MKLKANKSVRISKYDKDTLEENYLKFLEAFKDELIKDEIFENMRLYQRTLMKSLWFIKTHSLRWFDISEFSGICHQLQHLGFRSTEAVNVCEFDAQLVYIGSLRPGRAKSKTLFQNKGKKKVWDRRMKFPKSKLKGRPDQKDCFVRQMTFMLSTHEEHCIQWLIFYT